MSEATLIRNLLSDLNSKRNYIVQRYVSEIPENVPMRIVDADLKMHESGDCTTMLVIDGRKNKKQLRREKLLPENCRTPDC